MIDGEHFRNRAIEVRERTKLLTHQDIEAQLLALAAKYDKMAEDLDAPGEIGDREV